MLETKDYWTIGASIAAVLVSSGALFIASLSYRLTKARDRRDVEREMPSAAIVMPLCEGRGPWYPVLHLDNRGKDPVEFIGVTLPWICPLMFVLDKSKTNIDGGIESNRPKKSRAVQVRPINLVLKPGEQREVEFAIGHRDRKQLATDVLCEFMVNARSLDREGTLHRLKVFRSASAERVTATP